MSRSDTIGTHKTAVYTDSNGDLCVKYHATVVWRRHPDGTVTLDSGGWRTRTTMLRMCQAFRQFGIPLCVQQVKFAWRIGHWDPGHWTDFEDGMRINPADFRRAAA
jgi:hypothetical protein